MVASPTKVSTSAAVDCAHCCCIHIMSSSAMVRRRVHHGDVGGKRYDRVDASGSEGLSEPLLANDYDHDHNHEEDYTDWKDRKTKEEIEWTHIFSRVLVQWTQWLFVLLMNAVLFVAAMLVGSGAVFGTVVHRVINRRHENEEKTMDFPLTPVQEERLKIFQERLQVPFDGTKAEHRDALVALWETAYPDRELKGLVSEQWKDMGWQGSDPSTDFRGGGFISLENLLFFARQYPKSFSKLLFKEEGKRSAWEYPFAVAGLNISFMLIQLLDLRSDKPSSRSGLNFIKILAEDEMAFDTLYCIAFEIMDAHWLAMRASYMEFNAVLKATRAQLERELSLDDVCRVQDLPAYNLLCR